MLIVLISGMTVGPAIAGKKPAASDEAWKNRTFTTAELKKYTGRNGMPAYVAVDGVVYDVSKARGWTDGVHMKMHEAGTDLSEEMRTYTHKKWNILERLPKMGVILAKTAKLAGKTEAAEKPGPSSVTPYKIGEKEFGKKAVCPVTGKKFKVAAGTMAAEYKGKIYYFYCLSCYGSFKENPEKYLTTPNVTK